MLAIHQNHTEIVKCLVSKGAALYLGFNIFECLTPEIQKIIHVASVADHISEGGKLTNPEEEVKSIDSDIFLSRYKHHLSTTGYIKSYQEHIDDINKCCPVLSPEKDALIQSILQDQEDFNMECASIFHTILGVNNPMPMSMIVELLKENGDKEIPAEVQGIVDFYDQNSSLKIDNIIEYLNANYLNENDRLYKENAFKEKITQANVEVFSFKLPSIFKQSNNDDSNFARLSDFLYNSPTPVKLVEEIDTYCKLAALGNLYDEFSDE